MKVLIFVFFITLLLTGCNSKVNRDDVIGVYYSNHGHGEEKLELLVDGNYVLTYTVNGKITMRNTNSWEFESGKSGVSALSFKGFLFGYRDMTPSWGNIPGWWRVDIERSWQGKIELNTNPDLGYYYIRY